MGVGREEELLAACHQKLQGSAKRWLSQNVFGNVLDAVGKVVAEFPNRHVLLFVKVGVLGHNGLKKVVGELEVGLFD